MIPLRLRAWFGLFAIFLCLLTRPAFADNLADEADLEFQMGAELYKGAKYRDALEHFLASNRLVPNNSVLFNIARTYERLNRSADAYRYYWQALAREKDPSIKTRLDEAIARVAPLVAVLSVRTTPPGATIYIERKDLGPQGDAPINLGLVEGVYTILADLPGYEPVEVKSVSVKQGVETPLALTLRRIVGTVDIRGEPSGAVVRVDSGDAPPLGTLPGTFPLPPGQHTLLVSREGYVPATIPVKVTAYEVANVHAKLAPIEGNLVVGADASEARVEVDGRALGVTPAVLNLPIGIHRVRVSLAGFRPYETTVQVQPDRQSKVDAELMRIEEVTAASRVAEDAEDAPSSVTIISGQELRAMGYPTIAEALRGVRGVFVSYDTTYGSVGFRGFSPPGDYGNRVLVLLDGHPTNDNWIGQSYVGYDGRVDLADIERIEIVRGPGSVLHGNGAFFGVINLVTRNRGPTGTEIGVSTSGNYVGTARVMQQVRLSDDAGMWMSVAGAHSSGRDYFFPDYASDPATGGVARNSDGLDAGTINGRAWYKALSLEWFLTSRKKKLPSGEFATIFADGKSELSDTRGYLEARFEPKVAQEIELLTRAHVNMYNYDSFLSTAPADGGNATETYRGQWAGLEQRVAFVPSKRLRLTIGGEIQRHFLVHESGVAAGGPLMDGTTVPSSAYLNRNDPFSVIAGYVSGDAVLTRGVRLSAGSRIDYYTNFGSSLNPRVALIVKPYERGNLKLMLGKAFRAPSAYEHYYTAPTQLPGGDGLRPEQIYSAEIEHSHHFSATVLGTAAAYTNYITNLISLGGSGTEMSPNQYANISTPVQTYGAEIELRREWRDGWMAGAQYSYQRSAYLNNDNGALRDVANSPNHLASVKGAVPIMGRLLMVMSRLTFEGPRYTKYDHAGDPPQQQTDPVFVWDVVLSGEVERYRVRYNVGVYNAAGAHYALPVSREFTQATIEQNGRTFLAQGTVSF